MFNKLKMSLLGRENLTWNAFNALQNEKFEENKGIDLSLCNIEKMHLNFTMDNTNLKEAVEMTNEAEGIIKIIDILAEFM